jgi:hypothetical protein
MKAAARKRERVKQRVVWLLRLLEKQRGFLVAWDAEMVDAFVEAFPEAEKSLRVYLMGPNSSPMLNDAARRARLAGFIRAGHIGNQDARSYQQRTWCRTWDLTVKGRKWLAEQQPES